MQTGPATRARDYTECFPHGKRIGHTLTPETDLRFLSPYLGPCICFTDMVKCGEDPKTKERHK